MSVIINQYFRANETQRKRGKSNTSIARFVSQLVELFVRETRGLVEASVFTINCVTLPIGKRSYASLLFWKYHFLLHYVLPFWKHYSVYISTAILGNVCIIIIIIYIYIHTHIYIYVDTCFMYATFASPTYNVYDIYDTA